MRLIKLENGLPIGHWACAHRYLDACFRSEEPLVDESYENGREAASA